MIPEIKLDKYLWHHQDAVSSTGFIWELNRRIAGEELVSYILRSSGDFSAFSDMAKSLNGQVSIIIHKSPLTVLRSPGKNNKGIGDFELPNSKLSDLGKSDSPEYRELQESS